jgi:tetratricopeptide (TPR) repeat protein
MKNLFLLLLAIIVFLNCSPHDDPLDKAEAFIEIKRYENAVEQAEVVIMQDPKNERAHLIKGKAYLFNGEAQKAENEFDIAILLETGMKEKVANIYYQYGIERIDQNFSKAEAMFQKAVEKNPSFGSKISDQLIERWFSRMDISPEIPKSAFEYLQLAIGFCPPEKTTIQKEKLSERLMQKSIARKEKEFIKSSAMLALMGFQFNPLKKEEVTSHLLNLGCHAMDVQKDYELGSEILQAIIEETDKSIEENDRFYFYYHLKSKEPKELNIKQAEKFMLIFPESDYIEDVLFRVVQYHAYHLNYDKAIFYLEKLQSDFPATRYKDQLSKIEEEIRQVRKD